MIEEIEPALDDHPIAPRTIEGTGLSADLLLHLMLKTMYVSGPITPARLSRNLALPRSIITVLIDDAKEKGLMEALGALGDSLVSELRYGLSGKGSEWAIDALNQSQYVGAAPVTLTDYGKQVHKQLIANEQIRPQELAECFTHLVMPQELVKLVGPAVNSGRTILLYGPPGNGKTVIAQAIENVFEQTIFVPHCFEVDGYIIKMFDPTIHKVVGPAPGSEEEEDTEVRQEQQVDRRWIRCRRPVVYTGGELTLEMLDLAFNPISKFYEAPSQLKATGGLFFIDDFGRQLVNPQDVINRWIIPLETRIDFLTLHTGKKFPTPFDELLMFSTNIPPEKLVDSGALRRIHYKIEIGAPTKEDYVTIFENVCKDYEIELPPDLLAYLFADYYAAKNVDLARYHPKFIVDQIKSICDYEGVPLVLERERVDVALANLYDHVAMGLADAGRA